MTGNLLVAALTGGLLACGMALAGWATARFDPFPTPNPRPRRRIRVAWSRRTLAHALTACAISLIVWAATAWPVAGVTAGAAAVTLPRVLSGRAVKRRIARLDAMDAWSRQLADALTTGTGIEEALQATAENPPPPIATEVAALRRRLEFRTPTEDALRAFADDLDHPVGDTIAAALIIASTVRGRGLHDVLTALADTIAREVTNQREIDAERAAHRTTMYWVLAALALFTGFALVNRAYVAPYGTLTGQMALAFVAALYAATLGWLHKLATPPPGRRFLPKQDRR